MYIKDINILINNNYVDNDKFINIKNLKYIYLEDTVDLDVLNNSKLIDNFNFSKLVLFDLDINSNKPKKSIINTSTINKNKMVLIIANCEIPLIPDFIRDLHIINNENINFDNFPNNLEILQFNVFDVINVQLTNLPSTLTKLIINICETDKSNIILSNIKIPFGCDLEINYFCN